jgi:hypothetical protein
MEKQSRQNAKRVGTRSCDDGEAKMSKTVSFINLFNFLNLLFLTSCAIYSKEFDCLPSLGVPYTSETDLESMVIETNKGPDLFVPRS